MLVIAVLGWAVLSKQANRRDIATAFSPEVTVKEEVENVQAHSWRAVALNLPYSGNLSVTLDVVRGNPLDVMLIPEHQLDALKNDDWTSVQAYSGFNAAKTKTYQRENQMSFGNYYLVLRDTSLGIFSSPASDISLKVRLKR